MPGIQELWKIISLLRFLKELNLGTHNNKNKQIVSFFTCSSKVKFSRSDAAAISMREIKTSRHYKKTSLKNIRIFKFLSYISLKNYT